MAKSIYGFAQLSSSPGSAITEALRLYNRAVAQGAGTSGVIDNPDVFRQAREKYLEPLSDDIRISTKMAQSVNDEAQLRDKANDVNLASSVFKETVEDTLRSYAKAYYNSPSSLVQTTALVYNTAVDELDDEIQKRKGAGQGVGDLQSLLNTYATKADSATRLARQVLATGKPQNPNAYGWFVRTNPDDGTIVSIETDGVDSVDKQGKFIRTNSFYGGIPVWTNTFIDADGKEVARIGSNKYNLEKDKDTGAQVLKINAKQWGRYLKSLLPGGETPTQAKEASRTINLGAIQFGDVLNLPKGSIAKDASDNYYYFSDKGVFKAQNKDKMVQFLNVNGVPTNDLDKKAFPVSRNEVKAFGAFTNEDGTSRIIDDKMLGGLTTQKTQTQNLLPAMNQPVKGAFSTAPAPTPTSTPEAIPTFQVPRKTPGVKEPTESSGGNYSTPDIIQKGKEMGSVFSPIIEPFKALFKK